MRLTSLVPLALAAASTSAFTVPLMVPASGRSHPAVNVMMASTSVVTGPQGKPATSFEEDLRLTMQIIMDHEARSTTTSKEQMVQQIQESFALDEAGKAEPIDVSIPYDAAAKLAYETSDKSMEYSAFKEKFEADAVAAVIAKRPKKASPASASASAEPIDVSIPYDAAAKLAYEASDKTTKYAAFKEKFEADAVAAVIAKQPKKTIPAAVAAVAAVVDLSIPYDAAAKLAYEASDKSMEYTAFKVKYEADAVAAVTAKQLPKKKTAAAAAVETKFNAAAAVSVDLSIPYDAAAKLAYEASDKSMEYAAFKEKFEADAVADVVAKKST